MCKKEWEPLACWNTFSHDLYNPFPMLLLPFLPSSRDLQSGVDYTVNWSSVASRECRGQVPIDLRRMSDKIRHSLCYKVIHVHSHTQLRWTVLYFEPIIITFYTSGWQLLKLRFQKVILAFRTLRTGFQKSIKAPLQKEATFSAILYIDRYTVY